jgi:hypothetical protein
VWNEAPTAASFSSRGPIAAGATGSAWVSFTIWPALRSRLDARPTDLELLPVGGGHSHLTGQIRLWK